MNTQQQHKLIAKLKQLPKHGTPADNPSAEEQQRSADDAATLNVQLTNLVKTIPELSALTTKYDEALTSLNTTTAQASMGANKLIGIHNLFSSRIKELVKNVTFLEEANKSLVKSYGLSLKTGKTFGDGLRNIAISLDIGEEKTFAYAEGLKEVTGGFLASSKMNSDMRTEMIKSQAVMQNQLGVTAAAAEGYELYARSLGTSGLDALAAQKSLADELEKTTGMDSLSIQKSLTEEIGALTADLQYQYSRIPGELELAVLKSKMLGVSMEQLHNAGKNFLNIESSIGQELEYQLLTGQRLLTNDGKSLTNEYRLATVRGESTKQAELLNEFLTKQSGQLKTNIYAREKAAQMFNMSEADLMKSLQRTELISKMGATRLMELKNGDIKQVVAELRATGKAKEEDIKNLLQLSDTRTTQEIANDRLASIDTNIKLLAGGGIDMLALRDNTLAGIKPLMDVMKSFDSNRALFGKLGITTDTWDALTEPLADLSRSIPVLGDKISSMITLFNSGKKLDLPNAGDGAVKANDAIIVPNRGPIIRPAANDVIAAFRPNDVIHNTLNATTPSTAPIDYNQLAMAVASAIKNIKVEATVKSDTLFGETYLNRRNMI